MAGIDIDLFGEHESRPDNNTETGEITKNDLILNSTPENRL